RDAARERRVADDDVVEPEIEPEPPEELRTPGLQRLDDAGTDRAQPGERDPDRPHRARATGAGRRSPPRGVGGAVGRHAGLRARVSRPAARPGNRAALPTPPSINAAGRIRSVASACSGGTQRRTPRPVRPPPSGP